MAVVLAAAKDILPVPPAPSPIAVLLFDQLYTVPATEPVKLTVTPEPEHTVWLVTAFTVAVGFTVIVYVTGLPVQVTPPVVYTGVTVMVATTGILVTLVAVKAAILPVPLAARPMEGVLFVQL